jgi:hypothetical protein
MGEPLAPEYGILLLRLVVVGGLYLFLGLVALAIVRDLRRGPHAQGRRSAGLGRLIVIDTEVDAVASGQTFDLEPVTTIGRDPGSVVEIPDTFASGSHAVLSRRQDSWWIEDTGSTNGTFVNHEPVTAPTVLAYGDAIQIGRVTLKLVRE